jgi:transposase-like protein
MTLLEVCTEFSSDDRCRELLTRLRWPDGVRCPRCSFDDMARLSPKLYYCRKCDYQFSVTVGTMFADSHLPLLTWFAAVSLLCESKESVSAKRLERTLGVAYQTAWQLRRRIRDAMRDAEMGCRSNHCLHCDLFIETLRCMVRVERVNNRSTR